MSCAVLHCHNARRLHKHVTYYRPSPSQVTTWMKAIGRPIEFWTRHKFICSDHFKPTDIITFKNHTRLKPDAVPSLNLNLNADTSDYPQNNRLCEEIAHKFKNFLMNKDEIIIKIEYCGDRSEISEQANNEANDSNTSKDDGVLEIKSEFVEEETQIQYSSEDPTNEPNIEEIDNFNLQDSKKIHNLERRPFKCDTCHKSFAKSISLNVHKKYHENNRFKCDYCDETFYWAKSLRAHRIKHTGEKPFKCDLCPKQFRSNHSFCLRKLTHSVEGKHLCEFCGERFHQLKDLLAHKKDYKEKCVESIAGFKLQDNQFQCNFCGQILATRFGVSLHKKICNSDLSVSKEAKDEGICNEQFINNTALKTHIEKYEDKSEIQCDEINSDVLIDDGVFDIKSEYNEEETQIQYGFMENQSKESNIEETKNITSDIGLCEICGSLVRHLRKHKNKIHVAKDKECDICSKRFHFNYQLEYHKKRHAMHSIKKPHTCTICSKSFKLKSLLEVHHRTHTEERPFKCDICEKSFTNPSSLKFHKKFHANNNRFKCDYCDESFYWAKCLRAHRITHTGEEPFKCDICSKPFRTNHSLGLHKLTHSNEEQHMCEICGKTFHQLKDFVMHKKIHRKEKCVKRIAGFKLQGNKFKCNFCGKLLTTRFGASLHKKICNSNLSEQAKRPHKCNVCGKRFTQKCNLNIHIRTHTGEKPFKCKLCTAKFISSSNLKEHMRVHTKN